MGPPLVFPRHMSDSDTVMWHIERNPVLRSTITAIVVLDRSPDWERVVDTVDRASRRIVRMRQRVVEPPLPIGPPTWVVDPHFDLAYHLRRVGAPYPRDLRAVLEVARAMAMSAFDPVRPLWEFCLVDGLDEGAALVMKIHHSLTDGVGGFGLALDLFDAVAETGDRGQLPVEPPGEAWSATRVLADGVGHELARAARAALDAPRRTTRVARAVVSPRTLGSIGHLLRPVTTTLSPVLRGRGTAWDYELFTTSLDDLKRAAKATGGSLNDAFVAGVVGGLARYHDAHGTRVDRLRMNMPVSVRRPDDPAGGNRFIPMRFVVPVDDGDPTERVRRLGRVLRAERDEPSLEWTDALASVLAHLPRAALTAVFGSMLEHLDFVATNVPGFPDPVWLGGAKVTEMFVLPPPAGAAVNVGLVTHVDTCCVGIVSDAVAVPDHELLRECVEEGLDEIVALGR